jgi:hypothetical protein
MTASRRYVPLANCHRGGCQYPQLPPQVHKKLRLLHVHGPHSCWSANKAARPVQAKWAIGMGTVQYILQRWLSVDCYLEDSRPGCTPCHRMLQVQLRTNEHTVLLQPSSIYSITCSASCTFLFSLDDMQGTCSHEVRQAGLELTLCAIHTLALAQAQHALRPCPQPVGHHPPHQASPSAPAACCGSSSPPAPSATVHCSP